MDKPADPNSSQRPIETKAPFVLPPFIVFFLLVGGVTTAVFSTFGFLADYWWTFELMCHFRLQYLVLLSIAGILLFFARPRWHAFLLLACAASNAWCVLPIYSKPPHVETKPDRIRVCSLNLLTINEKSDLVLDLIGETKPDVIFFSEYGTFWQRALKGLRVDYPYSAETVRDDNFGFAIFSRHKVEWGKEWNWGREALVEIPASQGRKFRVFGAHPVPPSSKKLVALRNSQLKELAEGIEQGLNEKPNWATILLGDLNSTSWSPAFQRLVNQSGLIDSRLGFGLQPSWPTHLPMMKIPIDHILVSKNVRVENRWLGPNVGSDHFPVLMDFTCQ